MVSRKKERQGKDSKQKESLKNCKGSSPISKAMKRNATNDISNDDKEAMVDVQAQDKVIERIAVNTNEASKKKKNFLGTTPPKKKQKTTATDCEVKGQDQSKDEAIDKDNSCNSPSENAKRKITTDVDMKEHCNGKNGEISDTEKEVEEEDQQYLGKLIIDDMLDDESESSELLDESLDTKEMIDEVNELLLDEEDENLPSDYENIDEVEDEDERTEVKEMKYETPKDGKLWKLHKWKEYMLYGQRDLACKPLSVYREDDDTILLALAPYTSVYFQGIARVHLVVGSVKISGYEMEEGEEHTVYSLISHSLLALEAKQGIDLSIKKDIPGISKDWIQELMSDEIKEVIIVKLTHHFPPMAKLLYVAGWRNLVDQAKDPTCGLRSLHLISRTNSKRYPLYQESPEWETAVENIKSSYMRGKVPCVVVAGGQKVGKSTFFRYLVNSLLSMERSKGVLCLDFDPGQAELSLPTCLTFLHVKSPLLGPPYTHLTVGSSDSCKQILIGATTPQFVLQKYLNAVQSLSTFSHNYESLPLVINTMGWTNGTGIDLILDVIRITQPTHVMQICSEKRQFNYPFFLNSETVENHKGGIATKPGSSYLEHQMIPLRSVSVLKLNLCNASSLREISVLSYFSQIINQESKNKKSSMKGIVKIKWCDVVLHVFSAEVPREKILQAMNASLVTLCKVDPNDIETVGPYYPKQLVEDADFRDIIGWGIVRGIDPLTQELYVLTDLSEETVAASVNAIIMPDLYLPTHSYTLFAENSKEAPYMEQPTKGDRVELVKDRVKKPQKYSVRNMAH
ncbi:polynucleotide 5'-hydroxyl-kinase NOL9-like isoform X2 [Penaeus chinensis]|nr:polynucleotide 5'-hydroxyl-kinase NOL9-like isoform X2 [Penaeus chinensis]XP_047477881.1 polynucleotide 5'-hydroxyl-kinase NOL9-like isoform X2 [Penaeus chinensis]